MPDSTHEAIDRFFDFVDSSVEKLDHVFNRGKQSEEKHRARRSAQQPEVRQPKVIEAEATEKPRKASAPSAPSTATALARKPRFRIVESITPAGTTYVVTDGGNARTACSTRESAEKVLRALEGAA